MNDERNLEDLQAVSQHILECNKRMVILEEQKRNVDPASERFQTLSNEIEALAEEIRSVSHAETSLAREVADQPGLPTVAEADEEP